MVIAGIIGSHAVDALCRPATGALSVHSDPPQAEIILDGVHTGKVTPSVLLDIDTGEHTLEVSIPEYLFARRLVRVIADSILPVSFELISSLDTAYIFGERSVGVLMLERLPPASPPYLVDGIQARSLEISLNEGSHRVQWNGRHLYQSLDTVVQVARGQITHVAFSPRRLTGICVISPWPAGAEVLINGRSYGYGECNRVLPTGAYRVEVRLPGYYSKIHDIEIMPGKRELLEIVLSPVPDRDRDGFLDSADRCPDAYGLYGGCPKPRFRDAMRQNVLRLADHMRSDPLGISVTALGCLYRRPTNTRLGEIMGYYGDAGPLMNNVTGVIAANSCMLTYKGAVFSCELGQWNNGLQYRKSDTLMFGDDSAAWMVLYDSLGGVEPGIYVPGTALSAGFHFTVQGLDAGYTLGIQFEDIIFTDLVRRSDGQTVNLVFDNDWWFHQLFVAYQFDIGTFFLPCAYARFKLSFGPHRRTGWNSFEAGTKILFRPAARRRRPAAGPAGEKTR